MIILLACLYAFKQYDSFSLGAPIPELSNPLAHRHLFTRDDPTSTSADCSDRSVWDILWSCLATTFAVTWVSVHPNVPMVGEGDWSILRRRVFLMILALIAPEIMVMWAFKQWRGALAIRDVLNSASGVEGERFSVIR